MKKSLFGKAIQHIRPHYGRMWGSSKKQNKDSINFAKSGFKELKHRLSHIKTHNNPECENAPDINDFNAVLKHWKLEEQEIPKVLRGLKAAIASHIILIILLFYGLWNYRTIYDFTTLCLIILAIMYVVATKYWRYWVIKNRKMVFFKDWIIQNY